MIRHAHLDLMPADTTVELLKRCSDHILKVARLAVQFDGAALDTRHGEQIAHQPVQAIGFFPRGNDQTLAMLFFNELDCSSRLVSAPVMETSGVRRSCEMELSRQSATFLPPVAAPSGGLVLPGWHAR